VNVGTTVRVEDAVGTATRVSVREEA